MSPLNMLTFSLLLIAGASASAANSNSSPPSVITAPTNDIFQVSHTIDSTQQLNAKRVTWSTTSCGTLPWESPCLVKTAMLDRVHGELHSKTIVASVSKDNCTESAASGTLPTGHHSAASSGVSAAAIANSTFCHDPPCNETPTMPSMSATTVDADATVDTCTDAAHSAASTQGDPVSDAPAGAATTSSGRAHTTFTSVLSDAYGSAVSTTTDVRKRATPGTTCLPGYKCLPTFA